MGIEYIGNIIYDKEILYGNRKIVIFGCGIYGKKIAEYLLKNGAGGNIICFCDSDNSLRQCSVMGIPVRMPGETCRNYPDADYLISGKFSGEMYEILKDNNIEKIHILAN